MIATRDPIPLSGGSRGRFKTWDGLAARAATSGRHLMAFAGDSLGWSPGQWQAFWGDFRAQAIPNVAGSQMLSVVPASYFTTPDWAAFANELRGVQEVIRWTLYHYRAIATLTTNLLFFDQSEGTAAGGRLDTNMMNPGSLPGNEMMVVVGIGVDPVPRVQDVHATNAADMVAPRQWYTLMTTGWLEVKISGKEYLVMAPITRVPPGHGIGTGLDIMIHAANTDIWGHLQSASPDNRAKYNVDPPFGILPLRPFEARLRWNVGPTLAGAGRIGVNFNGWKIRPTL